MNGAIILDKPQNITSQGAVNRIRKIFGTKKVGHTGTLDPMATGVLTVLVGNAVKASELLLSGEKEYVATLKLGIVTDTQDVWGKEISRYEGPLPSYEKLCETLENFKGEIFQKPPMYSALKRNGQKLYELARNGIDVEVEARPIKIYSLRAEKTEAKDEFEIYLKCSKGTYIRTLCNDIGNSLGCGGTMKTLRRIANGDFDIQNSVSIEELEKSENPQKYLIPTEKLFEKYPFVKLSPFFSRLAKCGNEIYIKKIGIDAEVGEIFRTYDSEGNFFALTQCKEFEQGKGLANLRMFAV